MILVMIYSYDIIMYCHHYVLVLEKSVCSSVAIRFTFELRVCTVASSAKKHE